MVRLLACPACDCHAFATETHCPSCGSSLRTPDGSLPRTAGAILLGLTLTTATACGDSASSSGGGQGGQGGSVGQQMVSAYGVGPGGGGVGPTSGVGGQGGTAGTGGAGGTAGTGGAGGN